VRRLGAITLSDRPLPVPASLDSARLLARGIAQFGLVHLPWPEPASQLRERVEFVRRGGEQDWPDLSDGALSATAEEWLAPHLVGRAGFQDITAADVAAALDTLVTWDMKRRLEAATPTHLEVPTGSRVPIDYAAEGGPAASVRVQELFGLDRHPAVGEGRIPLVLNLLSPAGRPIQITRDLPAFWRGSWAAVRSEMRGRYPRHPWPEDPVAAAPTRRAKPRGT
jgi:ATP-dependent helicase HrpB